ncbi:unnamed protein product [Effrenium voratum]|nr:unnamed protein product [Effrenium voratum]
MTFDLGRVLNVMMVRPLAPRPRRRAFEAKREKMFSGLLKNAQSLMDLCSSAESSDSDEDDETRSTELELIERALDKLARIAKQALNKNVISKEEMANKSEYEKAVLVEILGAEVSDPQGTHLTAPDWAQSGPQRDDMESKLQTWEFNTLDQDEAGLERMAMHIFFDSEFGVASEFCEDDAIFKSFFDAVKPQYKEVPYHCFAHACDVLHTVFRFCGLTNGRLWMRKVDQYALLISALCHDMGHEGRTNPFLVESKDTLAITYNDKSPLENMHCARLFTLCTDEKTNAFGKASPELYKEARKVAVAAILHTDNANHFEMIKDISQVYEAHEKSAARTKQEPKPACARTTGIRSWKPTGFSGWSCSCTWQTCQTLSSPSTPAVRGRGGSLTSSSSRGTTRRRLQGCRWACSTTGTRSTDPGPSMASSSFWCRLWCARV